MDISLSALNCITLYSFTSSLEILSISVDKISSPSYTNPEPFNSFCDKPENLDIVKEYFGYSNSKALEILDILTDDDINNIRKVINTGGR